MFVLAPPNGEELVEGVEVTTFPNTSGVDDVEALVVTDADPKIDFVDEVNIEGVLTKEPNEEV